MFLRVGPAILVADDVPYELPAEGIGAKRIPIRTRKRAEGFCPFGLSVKPVGVIDGVPGLMAQQHHDHGVIFDLPCLLFLDTRQPLVSKVERHANDRHLIGAAPTVGQVKLGFEFQPFPGHFAAQPLRERFQRAPFGLQSEIANAGVEQFVTNCVPTVDKPERKCRVHELCAKITLADQTSNEFVAVRTARMVTVGRKMQGSLHEARAAHPPWSSKEHRVSGDFDVACTADCIVPIWQSAMFPHRFTVFITYCQ